jgi:pimeloyl-ACP methyl ester carboxylesterase
MGAVLISTAPAATAAPLTGSPLEPGPFPVGFRSSIARDPGRGYPDDARAGGQGQRPILLAVWYPAEAKPAAVRMKQGQYFDVKVGSAADAGFVKRLNQFGRDVLYREVLDVAPEFATDADAHKLQNYLESGTLAVRDAPARAGKFPLLIHHPGLAAAFEDQAPLLEQLASHGYVVVTSAFQPSDPQTVAIDGDLYRSAADVDFILSQLRRDPQVDPDRVAMMGHSFGGIASMATAMRNPLIAAVVCFDSTLDYHRSAQLPLDQLDLRIFREPDRLLVPTLAFARPYAKFDLLRSFKRSDRTLVKMKVVDHNSFIWHGPAAAQLRGEASAGDGLTAYRNLALWTRRFLDAWL